MNSRTRTDLAAAKARGKRLGGFRGRAGTAADCAKARRAKSLAAKSRAADLAPGIEDTNCRCRFAPSKLVPALICAPERRQSEQQVWTKFEDARPLILGALLDAVAHGLRQLPTVHLDRLRRMADELASVTRPDRQRRPL
jgi:hypothetical protein